MQNENLLKPRVAAERLAVSPQTLKRWRRTPGAPVLPYVRISPRAVRYDERDVAEFIRHSRENGN